MADRYLRTRRAGAVLWVEIVNPEVNFLNMDMLAELYDIVSGVRSDGSVRVLVLTGGIEDTYIMHFSIAELVRVAEESKTSPLARLAESAPGRLALQWNTALGMLAMDHLPRLERMTLRLARGWSERNFSLWMWLMMHRLYRDIERLNVVTIAAINGNCNGGGTELSCCFDFRFMVGDQGFKLGQPEVLVGIIPGGGSTQRLPRLIGKARALEWMLQGNQLDPQEARGIGLLTGVFDKAEFRERVQEFAERMAGRPPLAVDAVKRAVHEGSDTFLARGLAIELLQSLRCFKSADAGKAMREYIKLLEERVDVPPERRIEVDELMEIMENARFVDGFSGC